MSNYENTLLSTALRELAEEGRDVQLYDVNGQTLFPLWNSSGGLLTDAAVYPILRGKGDRCPAFTGQFPMEDGETLELGNGWVAMCVRLGYHLTALGKIAKIQAAETKLRQHIRENSNAT